MYLKTRFVKVSISLVCSLHIYLFNRPPATRQKFLADVALFSQVQYLQSNKQFIGRFYHETIPEIFKHFAYKINWDPFSMQSH